MDSLKIISSRMVTYSIVATVGLLALLALKAIFIVSEPLNGHMRQDVASPHQDAVFENDKTGSNYNNAVYFTSAEAEFEWNLLQVPNYDPGKIDTNRLMLRVHDSERRRLEVDTIQHGTLRGPR